MPSSTVTSAGQPSMPDVMMPVSIIRIHYRTAPSNKVFFTILPAKCFVTQCCKTIK